MNELALVEKLRRWAGTSREMVLGIGDDCAIYRPKAREDLLFTTDQLIESVHFRPDLPPSGIGERALARSLSDIAAMFPRGNRMDGSRVFFEGCSGSLAALERRWPEETWLTTTRCIAM
jgi:hypothetical protein